jgi:acyl-CoA synthetase (AMP-forming)/AMP-acid ligase II
MPGGLDGLRQLTDIAKPRTLKRLAAAGTFSPKTPFALATAIPYLVGRGPSLGILSQLNSFTLGNKAAIIDHRGSISFRELDKEVNRTARAILEAGVKPGDNVALLMRNGREMAQVILACQKTGIVACPVNTWAKTKELKAVMANIDPALVVYDTGHREQAEASLNSDAMLVHVGDDTKAIKGSVSLEQLLEGASSMPLGPLTRSRGSVRIIIQTSGTTGTPKGAARDASASGLGALANLLGTVPYKREDIVLCPAPLFHSFGLITFTLATALGMTIVLPSKFDPEDCLRAIEDNSVTAASFVPVMIRRIVSLDESKRSSYDLSSLRIVLASGSVLSLDLKKAAMELFGEVLYDLYGSTEAGWVAIATPDDILNKPKSLGRPVDGIEVAIFDKDGNKLEAGATGDIYIKSDVIFEGYTSGDSKHQRDGYISIGDVGHLDADGHLYIESRGDDMVVIGGENVYPIEVEEVIESLDGVSEVTVLGLEDDEYGHVLAAYVVGSASPEQIEEACKQELASYKVPKKIEILDELPRTSTGKVLKRDLASRS